MLWLGVQASAQQKPEDQRKGTFTGELQLSPVGDGTRMRVLQPISYDDGEGHKLNVPSGFLTDGASIPRALWTVVGSPFSGGNYIEAAVIHDEGCVSRIYPWDITHRMFYTAMLASGVPEHQAKLLYYGVRLGGPRWTKVQNGQKTEVAASPAVSLSEADLAEFDRALTVRELVALPISLEEIDETVIARPPMRKVAK